MTKLRIKVTYDGPLDMDLDDDIRAALKHVGADWYAQGTDMVTGARDLAFDWDSEEIYQGADIPAYIVHGA